jgi:hypothetical protein
MIIKANILSFKFVFLCSAAITAVGAISALFLRETTKEMGGKAEVSTGEMM